jgi:hypothetical protein
MLNSDDIAQTDLNGEMSHLLAISWAMIRHSPKVAKNPIP